MQDVLKQEVVNALTNKATDVIKGSFEKVRERGTLKFRFTGDITEEPDGRIFIKSEAFERQIKKVVTSAIHETVLVVLDTIIDSPVGDSQMKTIDDLRSQLKEAQSRIALLESRLVAYGLNTPTKPYDLRLDYTTFPSPEGRFPTHLEPPIDEDFEGDGESV